MHFKTIRKKGFSQRLEAVKALENKSRDDKATLLAAVETQRNTRLIKDLIIHIVFLTIFLLIVLLQLNPTSVNNINTSLKNSFLYSSDNPYMDIKFPDDFKNYLTTTFSETVSEMTLDNEDAMNKIIGNTIRIRTTRIKPGSCTDSGLNLTCYSNSYDSNTKDRSPYGPNGIFKYTSNSHGSYVFGHNQYVWDRSGYYVDIPVSNITLKTLELIENGFIDVQTRAVIISFSTLNLNFQSRTTVFTMLTEFPASGEANPYYSIRTYRVNMYMDSVDRFRGFLECSFFLFLIYYVYFFINEGRIDFQLGRLKFYLLSFKNSFDLINLILFITSTALYIAFLGDNSRELSLTDETVKYPLYLENLGQTALVLYQISAINILLMAFKTFRFLIIHKRLYILWIAISQSKLQLITFTIMFCIMMLGFLFSGWLVFGVDNAQFDGFVTSLGTLLQFIIGNPPDYEAMSSNNRALGPIYYLLFTIFMFFILVNMFIAIVSNSYQNISNAFDKKKSKRYLMTKWSRSVKSFELLFRRNAIDIYDLVVMVMDQRNGLIETVDIEPFKFKEELLLIIPTLKDEDASYYADILMKVHRNRQKYLQEIQSPKNTGISFELKLVGSPNVHKKDFESWKKDKVNNKKKVEDLATQIDLLNAKLDLILSSLNIQLTNQQLSSPPTQINNNNNNNSNNNNGNSSLGNSTGSGNTINIANSTP